MLNVFFTPFKKPHLSFSNVLMYVCLSVCILTRVCGGSFEGHRRVWDHLELQVSPLTWVLARD